MATKTQNKPLTKAATKRLTEVLKWVNDVRKQHGLRRLSKLPKGAVGTPHLCVIGKAIKGRAYLNNGYVNQVQSKDGAVIVDRGHEVQFPDFITKFIEDFDNGKYPHLLRSK